MNAAEFSAIVARLGWSEDRAAAELGVTPHVVAAWTSGSVKVPARIAAELRWQFAHVERRAILAASGLPECETLASLARAAEGKRGEAYIEAADEARVHSAGCATCQARIKYADQHGPPLPEPIMPGWMRFFQGAMGLIDRLPPPIRPPDAPQGEGRRIALLLAGLSVVIELLLIPLAVSVGDTFPASVADGVKALALVLVGHMVGFTLAGTVYDLLFPIRRTLVGTMLRWGLCVGIGYLTISQFGFMVDSTPTSLGERLERALVYAVMAGLYGAWGWSKRRRRIAKPAPRR